MSIPSVDLYTNNDQCYLGKKRLEKAIEVYQKTMPGGADDRFTVSWLPFYLDPNAPKVGVPINERMTAKFGAEQVPHLNARMRAMGAAEGINFTHEGKAGNTRDAHRIVQLAKKKDDAAADPKNSSQDSVINSLFKFYFEEGGDITSHDQLVTAAARGGLDAEETRAWLDDGADRGGPEVDAEVGEAFARGVHGVPHFVINDKFEVSGAQDTQAFISEFLRAKQ